MTQNTLAPVEEASLAGATQWTAQGKMSYDLNGQQGNFSFRWVQQNNVFDIVLFGPLGITIATVTGDENAARIVTFDGLVRTAASPERLMFDALGLNLPVSAMTHWIRGVPGDERAGSRFDVNRARKLDVESSGFTQSGWKIAVLRRDEASNPSRIRITKPDAKLLVVVKNWAY
ncbi:MAG: outer membrane lipoprotein LolB [Candidatus Azotimanducaceae bacterium]|jgi:outer membrane lipoprotein LolB